MSDPFPIPSLKSFLRDKTDDGFRAALEHFSKPAFSPSIEKAHDVPLFVYQKPGKRAQAWSINEVCAAAEEALYQEERAALHLAVVRAELKRMGMQRLWSVWFPGEKLE